MRSRVRGFTLIELLVVIAIIGMLSSIVLASLNTARKKGRDARRLTDMKQIHLALELYRDANGQYPNSSLAGDSCWWLWESSNVSGGSTFLNALVSGGFMGTIPQESFHPSNVPWTGCTYRYVRFETTSTACGPAGFYAALYMVFENPVPTACHNDCTAGWGWGEGGSGDPYGCVLIMKE